MLAKLLEEIQQHHTLDARTLSKIMGTTPQMIESMIEMLIRMGQIKQMDICSSSHCDSCPVVQLCSTSENKPQIWQVSNLDGTMEDSNRKNKD